MKNLLIATTALVATAGMAAAEITFTGGARFGVQYTKTAAVDAVAAVAAVDAVDAVPGDDTNPAVDAVAAVTAVDAVDAVASVSSTDVHNRFTMNINATTETDSGVAFFAHVRVRGGNTGDGETSGTNASAPRVGAKIGGFTVAVGNIDGALEKTPGLYNGNVGLTGLGWGSLPINNSGAGTFAWDSFSSGGGGSNGVEFIYSANGFGAHLSQSGQSDRTAINVSYKFSDWTVALGHQTSDVTAEETTVLTVAGSIGDLGLGLAHANNDGDFDATRVNVSYVVGAGTTVTGYYTAASGVGREASYGLGFNHSLGGAALKGGFANSFTGQTVADLGVSFSF